MAPDGSARNCGAGALSLLRLEGSFYGGYTLWGFNPESASRRAEQVFGEGNCGGMWYAWGVQHSHLDVGCRDRHTGGADVEGSHYIDDKLRSHATATKLSSQGGERRRRPL